MSIAEDDSINFSSSGVGDDVGNREYPFITNPKVLEINRKLNEYHRKLLFQDFISSVTSQDYDNCPKGSIMSSQLKTSIPGPYFSCPFLHESGDDFFPLPFTKRGAMRPKLPLPISRRSKRKRPQCRKCQVIAFNHYDSNCYHEHYYLKYSTYSKIRTSHASFSRGSRTSRPKFEDEDEETKDSISSPNSAALSDIKDLIDPKKPYLLEDPAKSGKKRRGKSSSNRVSIQSRYQQSLSARKSRLDPMSSDIRYRSEVLDDQVEESPRNPFPMPDIFEEIYFGSMPESFSTLPLALQNFKKTQMKMAGDNGRQTVDPGPTKQTAKPVDLFPRLNRPTTSMKTFKPATPVVPPPAPDKSGSTKSAIVKLKGLRKISSPVNVTKRRSLVLQTSNKSHKLQSSSWPTVTKRKSNGSLSGLTNKTRKRRGKLAQRPTTGATKDVSFLSLLPKVNGDDYRKSVIKCTENPLNVSSTPYGDSSKGQKVVEDLPKRAEKPDDRAPLAITVYKSVTELGSTGLEWTGKSEAQLQNGNSKGRQERRKKTRGRPKTAGRASTAKGIDDAISRRGMVMASRLRHL